MSLHDHRTLLSTPMTKSRSLCTKVTSMSIILSTFVFEKNMDSDASPSAISFDENTENFCDNPTRDILAEGLMGLIKPTVDQLDERVKLTRLSQLALKDSVETVHDEIKKIIDAQYLSNVDLDSYVKKLYNTKQRVTVLANILQNAQERLNKIHYQIERETSRKSVIENSQS